MNILPIDFETYYDTDYTLSKLTTDGYILDPRYKTHGVGLRYPDGRYHYEHKDVGGLLASIDWANTAVLCHNTAFDGFILAHRYGVRPAMWLDTLSMARSLFGVEVGGSLKAVAEYYGLPPKGNELVQTKGKRELTEQEQAALGAYCLRDVEITWAAFTRMLKDYPRRELKLIDLTLRMFIEPALRLNQVKLEQYIEVLAEEKSSLLARVGLTDPASLNSADQFASALINLGVEPPTKTSLRTGKEAYAFAKTDEGLKQLLEHESDDVRWLVEARLGAKSNIDQNRADRFLHVARGNRAWPVLLNFSGASTTHRWSGGNKQNPQNLPARGKTRVLREAVEPPPGYKIVVADSSQIEARVLAACAGQDDLVQGFAAGEDVYSTLASDIYGFSVNKKDHPAERFVGKNCIAEGTLVLTNRGWVPIESVLEHDFLWDGVEWVKHEGLLSNGWKKVMQLCGVSMTPDHLVLSEAGWKPAQRLVRGSSTHYLQSVQLPDTPQLWGTSSGLAEVCKVLSLSALAMIKSILSIGTTLKTLGQRGVCCAQENRRRVPENLTGGMQTHALMTPTEQGCSIDFRRLLAGVLNPTTNVTTITGGAAFQYTKLGSKTGERFLFTQWGFLAGIGRSLNWIAQTTSAVTSRGIFGLSLAGKTLKINGKSEPCRKSWTTFANVYDLANAGPRNRFVVRGGEGAPFIVHNCVLGLGYGMGAEKFLVSLKAQGAKDVTPEFTKRVVPLYRRKYPKIPLFWKLADKMLIDMASGGSGTHKYFSWDSAGVLLPSGLRIRYPELRQEAGEWVYQQKGKRTKIYGAKLVENLCQALARCIIAEQMLRIDTPRLRQRLGHSIVLMAHDEIVSVVPERNAQTLLDLKLHVMKTPPVWGLDIPVSAEGDIGNNYGDAK